MTQDGSKSQIRMSYQLLLLPPLTFLTYSVASFHFLLLLFHNLLFLPFSLHRVNKSQHVRQCFRHLFFPVRHVLSYLERDTHRLPHQRSKTYWIKFSNERSCQSGKAPSDLVYARSPYVRRSLTGLVLRFLFSRRSDFR